jgi:hypothetical protein
MQLISFFRPHSLQTKTLMESEYPRVSLRRLSLSLAILTLAILSFILGNTNLIDSNHEQETQVEKQPEYAMYWFFHSVWHILCVGCIYLLLTAKEKVD